MTAGDGRAAGPSGERPAVAPGSAHAGHPLTVDLRAWIEATRRFPVMATIAPDGRPSQSVMWFRLLEDGTILMNTRRGRAKERNLRRDSRLSLCFEQDYDYLTLEGVAELRADPDNAVIDALRDAYEDDYDFSSQRGERVTIVMTVTRVLTHLSRL